MNVSPIDEILKEAEAKANGSDAAQAVKALQAASDTQSLLDNELSEEEQKIVDELEATDREVRSHEQAHKTVGGAYAGAISYETTTGPDGREYAIAGEVQIDASPIPGNPEATVRKLDVVIRAALAPAEPSSQDFAVARAAQAARITAQREVQAKREEELKAQRAENEAQNDPNSPSGVLEPEQKTQLEQLLESISVIDSPPSEARGNLFDAIN